MRKWNKILLCGLMCCGMQIPQKIQAEENSPKFDNLTLWYTQPSGTANKAWEEKALPIGNGYMGAKIFGEVKNEKIQFNEKTLWSGGPGEGYTGGNTANKDNGGKSLRDIQKLISEGKLTEAKNKMGELQGNENRLGDYQNFGFINLAFANVDGDVSEYTRSLDLKTAISSVDFKNNNINYTREYFMSYPNHVMVSKLTANQDAKINFTLSLESAQEDTITAENDMIVMKGDHVIGKPAAHGKDKNDMKHAAVLKIVPTGGSVKAEANTLKVENANSVVIYMSAATNYKNEYPTYRGTNEPETDARKYVTDAVAKGYDKVKNDHLDDYQALFNRVSINVGQETPTIPTNELLANYKAGYKSKALEMLYYQYGRYLLISSSRANSLPANLQGVWNAVNNPPWQSDYHLNVNLQMNYWPAYTSNLAETAKPLVDYVDSLRKPGRITANMYTGIGTDKTDGTPDPNQATGWMAHTQNGPMGNTGPGSSWQWGWAPTAGAWILQNTYDYYTFTKDIEYLANNIYPAMEESALMWSQLLIEEVINGEKTGRLVSSPTYSPEHGPVAAGNTFDQELIWQLYTNTIEAAKDLKANGKTVNDTLITKLKEQLPKLQPLAIGKWGQIKEWPNEDEWENRGVGSRSVQLQHRHLSHLLGLWPGNHITNATEDFLSAAKVSLNDRGNGGTGWSKAQKIGAWARALDGTRSHLLFEELLKHSTLDNLWDTHPPFQIDGNFGATAGVNEWFVQSHTNKIDLLPALPEDYAVQGEVKGLLARGNFEIGLTWVNDSLTKATIVSKAGNEAVISYPNIGTAVVKNGETNVETTVVDNNTIRFNTTKGETYTIIGFKDRPLRGTSIIKAYIVDTNNTLVYGIPNEQATSYTLYQKQADGTFKELKTQETPYFQVESDNVDTAYKITSNKGDIKGMLSDSFAPLELRGYTKIDDRSPLIEYGDGWGNWTDQQQFAGTEKFNDNGGEYAFVFSGTGFKIIGQKTNNLGKFDVYVDNVKVGTEINANATKKQLQATLFEKMDLQPGFHFVYVKVSDNSTSHRKMSLDAIEILGAPALPLKTLVINGPTVIDNFDEATTLTLTATPEQTTTPDVTWSVKNEQNEATDLATIDANGVVTAKKEGTIIVSATSKTNPSISATKTITLKLAAETSRKYDDRDTNVKYHGINNVNWSTWNEAKHENGTITEIYSQTSDITGAYFEIPFTGTGIGLNFTKLESSSIFAGGDIEVFIDGKTQGVFETFTTVSGSEPKVRIFEKRDLTHGEHVVKVVVHGATTKAPGKRPKVTFDAYEVFQLRVKSNENSPEVTPKKLDYTKYEALTKRIEALDLCKYTEESLAVLIAKIKELSVADETKLTQDDLDRLVSQIEEKIAVLQVANKLEGEDDTALYRAEQTVATTNNAILFEEQAKPAIENYDVKKVYKLKLVCKFTLVEKKLTGDIQIKFKHLATNDKVMYLPTKTIVTPNEDGFITVKTLEGNYAIVQEDVQPFSYEDATTKVKLNAPKGVLSNDVKVDVVVTEKHIQANPNSTVYDITLSLNGSLLHKLTDNIIVGLPVGDKEKNIKVYDIEKDIVIPYEIRDGYAYFTTNHFSEYGIVFEGNEQVNPEITRKQEEQLNEKGSPQEQSKQNEEITSKTQEKVSLEKSKVEQINQEPESQNNDTKNKTIKTVDTYDTSSPLFVIFAMISLLLCFFMRRYTRK